MNCHAQIWTNAEMLAPVRESFRSGKPLVWERANQIPDFVYFDHSIHLNKGVGCASCHGPVDRMPLMYAEASLQMEWCLNCHRAPEKFLRPRGEIFNMRYQEPSPRNPLQIDGKQFVDQQSLGTYLKTKYRVRNVYDITSCNTCHR
jgi:cytochrome c peroxidase